MLAKGGTVEGVASAGAVAGLAARHTIDMPIAAAVNKVLHKGGDIDRTITGLLSRPLRTERS